MSTNNGTDQFEHLTVGLSTKGQLVFKCDHIESGCFVKICEPCGTHVLEILRSMLEGWARQ